MKISITDQFLLDMYSYLEGAVHTVALGIGPRRSILKMLSGNRNPFTEKYRTKMGSKEFAKLIYYLKTKNYIQAKSLKGKRGIMLTKEGMSKALKASFLWEKKEKRKDGKWIMLTFDIPQKQVKARWLLRSVMENLGYRMFQQSIWVCPFDVSEKTEKLLQMYDLDRYVKIFLIEEL